jgi:hypothetical protein
MLLDGKGEELKLCGPPQRPWYARIEESHDRLQDSIRCKGVAAVNSQNALTEAEHHRTVGMDDDPIYFPQAQRRQTLWKTFLQSLHSP